MISFPVLLVILCAVLTQATGNWYYDHWCGHGLQYLDDAKCAKKFPTNFNRDWSCPVATLTTAPQGFYPDTDLANVKVDTTTLSEWITTSDVNACVVVTKRVKDATAENGVRLYHKYLCGGSWSTSTPFETWSSSKIFAMANAAGHLRTNETTCGSGDSHNKLFGLDGSVTGKHGVTPLGDLATVVCSYDSTAGYSSNSLSSYFHDLGWRDRIDKTVVNQWLLGNNPQGQSLGGNYGEQTPTDLGLTVNSTETSTSGVTCKADKDPWPVVYSNSITALSAVEMTRRIAQYREIPAAMRFPGAEWRDMQTIMYGAEKSLLFPELAWGGMTADTAIFVQSSTAMSSLLSASDKHKNEWRIFSKLGAGWSTSRSRGEIVTNAHACVPSFDADGNAVGGIEFTITVRGSVPGDSSLIKVQTLVMDAVEKTVNYVIQNY